MHDAWVTGTGERGVIVRSTPGWTKAELLSHADAGLQVEARDGSLPHLALAGETGPAARVNRFVGRFLLRDGKFEIEQGKLQTPGGIYQLSGTASLGRVLDVKLTRDGGRRIRRHRHTEPASRGHAPDSRDSGRTQTMKARSAFLFAVTAWALLVPHSAAQAESAPESRTGGEVLNASWSMCSSNGAQPRPDPSPTEFTEQEVNAYFASGSVKLPAGSAVRSFPGATGDNHWRRPGLISIELKAGKNSVQPPLSPSSAECMTSWLTATR